MSDEINPEWSIDPNGTSEEHWVDLISDSYSDGTYWTKAAVKWDGCIHLNKAGNEPFDPDYVKTGKRPESACDDYIHICDLSSYIKKLQKLETFAKQYFKDKNNEFWSY